MICPECQKPYYFLGEIAGNGGGATCMRCNYSCDDPIFPQYDNYHADLYESKIYVRNTKTDPQMRYILNSLNIQEKERVLDIGCGVGDYTYAIYSSYTKGILGIDHDILAAKKKYEADCFRAHDCNKVLPFEEGCYDAIVSINVIEHLSNPNMFLQECSRVLKKGGKIAITTANLEFFLHDHFFDKTHLYEWNVFEFGNLMRRYFDVQVIKKSSAMFNYYPYNTVLTYFLKPDIVCIGRGI